jgi:hypothetical protein
MATYDEMINKLSPEQVRQMFNQGFPSELPQSKTIMDYINPASYVDPIAPLLNRGADPARVMPDPTDASANRSSMPSFNLGNLTNYIPSASTIGEYIPREIPNVFGVNNPLYAGLLGADQSQALSKQSNIAGLLGAAAALVQGMGRQGGRRSAAQNIISALGAGYGSAGQQYQQGLQMYGQTQQLGLQQRQQAAIQAMKLKYPEYADEIDANPAGAFRLIAEREAAGKKPTVVSQGGTLVDPTGKVLFTDTTAKERKTAVVNGQLVDTATGQVIFGEPTGDKTSDIKNYEYYKSTVPVGQKVKTFDQWAEGVNKGTTVNVMPQGAVPLGKEGANKVDTALLDLGQNRLNLQSIAYNFKPEYLKDTFKLKMAVATEAEKKGLPVSNETKAEIANYSKFTQDAYNGLNAYINLITGAAVGSGEEEARIRKGVPDPQKDSPTEFWTKLNAKMKEGRLYEARLGYIKQNGMKMTDVDVNKIPTLMRQKEAAFKGNNKLFGNNPYNDKDPNHKAIVRALMSKEFGLME